MKNQDNPRNIRTEERIIAGKKVKVASSEAVKASSNKIMKQYDEAFKNLKDR